MLVAATLQETANGIPLTDAYGRLVDRVPHDVLSKAKAQLTTHATTVGATAPFTYISTFMDDIVTALASLDAHGRVTIQTPDTIIAIGHYYLGKFASPVSAEAPFMHISTFIDDATMGTHYIWEPRYLDNTGTIFEVNLQANSLNIVEIEKGVARADLPSGDTALVLAAYPGLECACYEIGYDFVDGSYSTLHSEYEECTTADRERLDVNVAPDGQSYTSDPYDRSLPCLYKLEAWDPNHPRSIKSARLAAAPDDDVLPNVAIIGICASISLAFFVLGFACSRARSVHSFKKLTVRNVGTVVNLERHAVDECL
eukprot:CAMPEP_0119344844 /NCGR_PEP_ID=MMETSP1333-20130426/107179_1 /TAXON_ID=418940 /ORGANISM="Scyphosphaera apsteinii, Strain RCC1455" /LENGTH=312 /DNA_ID=CAMNT_0007357293 /DNA_START=160 /DNA_END=1098 /DNA_ORIENTATION=-